MDCPKCKKKLKEEEGEIRVAVGDRLFTGKEPAWSCSTCREFYSSGPHRGVFELRVAAELARAGETSGDAMKFMRKALGLRGSDLAELLDVRPETISRWETGKEGVDRRSVALLALLVAERAEGRTTAEDVLRAVMQPKKRRLKLHYSGAELRRMVDVLNPPAAPEPPARRQKG